jgi:hypothetical protein
LKLVQQAPSIKSYAARLLRARGLVAEQTRPISSEESAAWMQMSLMTYDRLIAIAKPGQLVTFDFRGYVYNSSPVSMVKLLKSSTWLSITAIDPPAVGSTVEDYTAWLTDGAAGGTCVLLTAPGRGGKYCLP